MISKVFYVLHVRIHSNALSAEWEAVKNAEPAKEATCQPLNTDTSAVSNNQTEAYTQQVTMMPVQVLDSIFSTCCWF